MIGTSRNRRCRTTQLLSCRRSAITRQPPKRSPAQDADAGALAPAGGAFRSARRGPGQRAMNAAVAPPRDGMGKVPQVTALFWVIKIGGHPGRRRSPVGSLLLVDDRMLADAGPLVADTGGLGYSGGLLGSAACSRSLPRCMRGRRSRTPSCSGRRSSSSARWGAVLGEARQHRGAIAHGAIVDRAQLHLRVRGGKVRTRRMR